MSNRLFSIEEKSIIDILKVPAETLEVPNGSTYPLQAIPAMTQAAIEKSRSEGYSEGFNNGMEAGQQGSYDEGYTKGYDEGNQDGKQQVYDEFWNSIPLTEDGDIFLTTCGFAGIMWNDTTFVPNRNITADGDAQYAFAYSRTTDLKGILEQRNITLDISKANALQSSFSRLTTTRLPELNTTSAKSLEYMLFSNQNLVSVDKIILKEDGSQTITYFMRNCPSLVDVEFEGKIGATINVSASTNLSASSIANIVSALSDTASGKTLMLSKVAVDKAFETSVGANDGSTSAEWTTLQDSKKNWTIALS